MALLDALRSFVPQDANAQSGFGIGAQDYMNRFKLGMERDRLGRQELNRQLNAGVQIPTFNQNTFGSIDTGIRTIEEPVVTTTPEAGVQVPVPKPRPPIPKQEDAGLSQIPYPDYSFDESVNMPPIVPEDVEENNNASAEEKIELHVQGVPWKVVDKNGGKLVVHNGVEYNISDPGDGSSLILTDRFGRPNFPLTDAFTKGRAKGITNTEVPLDPALETPDYSFDESATMPVVTPNVESSAAASEQGTANQQASRDAIIANIQDNIEAASANVESSAAASEQGTANQKTVVDNTGREMDANPQGVTDQGGGLRTGSVAQDTDKSSNPTEIVRKITSLAENPNRLGFEFQQLVQIRNARAQFLENARFAGNVDTPEYQEEYLKLMANDAGLYVMQAYDRLNQFEYNGNPAALNGVLDAFTGGNVKIRARSDGKFDFIDSQGAVVEGMEALDMNKVKMYSRLIFDSKYKETIEAATSAKNKFVFEKNFETQLDAQLKLLQGNIDAMLKQQEARGYKVDKLNDETFTVSEGGRTRAFQVIEDVQVIDGEETTVPTVIEIPMVDYGGSAYKQALQ